MALEVLHGLTVFLDPVFSNLHAEGVSALTDPATSRAHTILDLGADEFTVGRLHPMIDPDLRNRRVIQESADPEVELILLDVVLGEGAHANPAEALAPIVRKALERTGLEIVVLLVGTDEDPQNLEEQTTLLAQAGALVFRSSEETIGYVAGRVGPAAEAPEVQVELDTLTAPFAAVNVGLEMFYSSLVAQEQTAVHVEWRPPAGGNERLMAILKKMKSGRNPR